MMEALKSEEPRFAPNIKLIYPYLIKSLQLGVNTSMNDSIEKAVDDIAEEFDKAGKQELE